MSAPWKVVGASVAGTGHTATELPGQDASAWCLLSGVACLTVADGAGSRPLAGGGSTAATAAVIDLARENLVEFLDHPPDEDGQARLVDWLRSAVSAALAAVVRTAEAQGRTPDEYATTVSIAVITDRYLGVLQVGDGIAVVSDGQGFTAISPSPRAEYANETTFLTTPGALDQVRIDVVEAATLDSVTLSTDGLRFEILADLVNQTPFPPFFEDVAKHVREPAVDDDAVRSFLDSLDNQSGDDKTLVVAARLVPCGPPKE